MINEQELLIRRFDFFTASHIHVVLVIFCVNRWLIHNFTFNIMCVNRWLILAIICVLINRWLILINNLLCVQAVYVFFIVRKARLMKILTKLNIFRSDLRLSTMASTIHLE